jgi:hypothetical protein
MPAASKPPPPPVAEVRAALQKVDWAPVLDAAKSIAMRVWEMDEVRADQLVGDAVAAIYDGAATGKGRLWNPGAQPNIKRFVLLVMRSLRYNEHRDHGHVIPFDPTGEEVHAATTNHPEQRLRAGAKQKLGEARRDAALARMSENARKVYRAIEEGTFLPKADFAARHGLTMAQVDAARQNMKYHLNEVIAADEAPPSSSGSHAAAPPAAPTRPESGADDEGGTGYES